jgi:hypothetical protein
MDTHPAVRAAIMSDFLNAIPGLRSRNVKLQMMDRQRLREIQIIELNRHRGQGIGLERLSLPRGM